MSELLKRLEVKKRYSYSSHKHEVNWDDIVEIVEDHDQPQLNENQQELLDDLKYVYSWQHSHAWDLFYYLVENDSEMFEEETLRNFQDMPEDDSLVVLEAFSRWVLERGDE